ncbi:hypothetical protein [Cognatiyoonia koreensis]|uniref:hypothetical protein n=1 Tax=Cognatiyoonia koreensis TaxID=364200 RepID=UPI0010425C65|nr:hypothetical protein [Cognatiyoonia koreensis]
MAALLCVLLAIANGGTLEGGHMVVAFALALILQSNMSLYLMSLNRTSMFGTRKHWIIAGFVQLGVLGLLTSMSDFTWCQHAITVVAIIAALRCVPGMLQSDEALAAERWSQEDFSGFRPQLCIGLFLLFGAYAVMNEILIKTLSAQDWLVLWMFLPVIHFYAAVILIDTLMMSAKKRA